MGPRSLLEITAVSKVTVLTLSREQKLNALSLELEQELSRAIDSPQVRDCACVIIGGSGRAFSAGADLTDFQEMTPEALFSYYRQSGAVYERVASLPQPTISVISGYCLGAGFELALATDLRIADATAVFGVPEVSFGLGLTGGTYRLARLVGPGRAKEILLMRPHFDAEIARAVGVLNEVTPEGKAFTRALEIGHALAEMPQLAVQIVKATVNQVVDSSHEAGVLIERLAYAMLAQTGDARQQAHAFSNSRQRRHAKPTEVGSSGRASSGDPEPRDESA